MMKRTQEESITPFQAYEGERVAGFAPAQEQAHANISEMTSPEGLADAGAGFRDVAAGAKNASYAPGTFTSSYTAGRVTPDYTAATLDPGYTAGTVAHGYTAGTATPSYTAGTTVAPEFDTAQAAKYMSPYQQNAIDIEKREATREGAKRELELKNAAVNAGAFGSLREGVVEAEHSRNLAQQLGDIQTRGQQAAYDRAAQQFTADRAAKMSATGDTQRFQQVQSQMGLAATQQNEAARQRQAALGLETFGLNESAQQKQGQLGLTAQQHTELGKQRQASLGLEAFGMNESAAQQQARLGLTAQQATEDSRQFGAKFEQANRDQQIKVGSAQAALAKSQQGLDSARFNLQNAVGADQRKLAQQNLDKVFDDFVNKRDYERQQLSFYNSMLRGIDVGEQREVRQMQPAPSGLGQVAGAGLGALGAYNAFK
jgi:hypothetical protein